MISKKFLFNTHKFETNTEFVSGFITKFKDCSIPLGNPCIISKQRFNLAEDKENITAIVPFGMRCTHSAPNDLCVVKKRDVKIRNSRCIVNNGIKIIESFDFNKLKGLPAYVDEKGSATFSFRAYSAYGSAIPTGKNVIEFIDRIASDILTKYRYHSILFINYDNDFIAPRGDLRYILHFVSIPNCVPIINHRKIDGIGIIFNIVSLNGTIRDGYLNPVFCMTIILSNYRENIFTIDGVEIEEQYPLDAGHLAVAEKIINRSIIQKGEYYIRQKKRVNYCIKQKKKEAKESSKDGFAKIIIDTSSAAKYTGSTATYTDFSDSNNQYYYTNS